MHKLAHLGKGTFCTGMYWRGIAALVYHVLACVALVSDGMLSGECTRCSCSCRHVDAIHSTAWASWLGSPGTVRQRKGNTTEHTRRLCGLRIPLQGTFSIVVVLKFPGEAVPDTGPKSRVATSLQGKLHKDMTINWLSLNCF